MADQVAHGRVIVRHGSPRDPFDTFADYPSRTGGGQGDRRAVPWFVPLPAAGDGRRWRPARFGAVVSARSAARRRNRRTKVGQE